MKKIKKNIPQQLRRALEGVGSPFSFVVEPELMRA